MEALDLFGRVDQRALDIEAIHQATAIYTVPPEVEALLDALEWPQCGGALLDPGAGTGGFVVAALARLDLVADGVTAAVARVKGYEFHPGAAGAARERVRHHLQARGWTPATASLAASQIIEQRDFLLSLVPVGKFGRIAQNPPYLRNANLPEAYREEFDAAMPRHVRGDLMHAYLQKAADIVEPGGVIGAITSDRWLINSGTAELRRQIGEIFTVTACRRLESTSAFYRPKARSKGTPARVHPVAVVLTPTRTGRALGAEPFDIDDARGAFSGTRLADLAEIQLAPWLGPEGIFVVKDLEGLDAPQAVKVIGPKDIHPHEDRLKGSHRWALVTERGDINPAVRAHLDCTIQNMPPRGRRREIHIPPETFASRLPLPVEAIVVPRIARRLRAVPLPAGVMPLNHDLVVVSGRGPEILAAWLNDPRVQAQALAGSAPLENGYRSFTATLLRELLIPADLEGLDV